MRTCEGYSRYRIGHLGYVFDIKLGRFLKHWLTPDGYAKVMLHKDSGSRKSFHLGRLVGLCYVSNPDNKPEINHKDGIKTNNSYDNLEWVTHAENIQHAWDTGLLTHTEERAKKINAQKRFYGKDNVRARSVVCLTTEEVFETIDDAEKKYNISSGGISCACTGYLGRKSAGKHPETGERLTWKYKENT